MFESTTIVAFDQHAASIVAAVLLPGQRTPALHPLASDLPTIGRFLTRLGREGGAMLLRSRALRLRAAAVSDRSARAVRRHRAQSDSAAAWRSHQNRPTRCPTARPPVSRGRADGDSHSDRAGEAARDLRRCREDIRADLLRARHRLSKFLLRHGRRFTGTKKAWSKRHDVWLRTQVWSLPALNQTIVRICEPSMKRWHGCGRSNSISAIC